MYQKLKSVLQFHDVFFVSLGYIVGAGIYSLLYLTAQQGGNFTWLSFVIGGIISICTGLSYSELTQHYDSNATEYYYFNKTITPKFKLSIALILIMKGIFLAITLLLALSNLSYKLLGERIPYFLITLVSIVLPTLINIYGVKLTSNFNMVISIIESSVLVILIIIGFKHWKVPSFTTKFNLNGVLYGAFLSVLSYSGYEALPKLSEETQDSTEVIPYAIVSSLILVIIMYSLVSITTNSILGTDVVGKTLNPVSKTFQLLLGNKFEKIINGVTLFSIFNTVMLTILITSRQIYGISKEEGIHPQFDKLMTKVNQKTKTPIGSIMFVSVLTLLGANFGKIEWLNHTTNLLLFFIFILVNLSALVFRYKKRSDFENENKQIKWYHKIGIHSSIGLISSLLLFIFSFKQQS